MRRISLINDTITTYIKKIKIIAVTASKVKSSSSQIRSNQVISQEELATQEINKELEEVKALLKTKFSDEIEVHHNVLNLDKSSAVIFLFPFSICV